jgi:hypothetical protein
MSAAANEVERIPETTWLEATRRYFGIWLLLLVAIFPLLVHNFVFMAGDVYLYFARWTHPNLRVDVLGNVFDMDLVEILLWPEIWRKTWPIWTLPSLLMSGSFLLYAASTYFVRAARRFDFGFNWFNRKFDIENKPLSAIGFVSGVIVACLYWGCVIVSKLASLPRHWALKF